MIVAIGGGELDQGQTRIVDDAVVRASGLASPRLLFVPTASKDAPGYVTGVKAYFEAGWGCDVRALTLTTNPSPRAVDEALSWAQVVYVGGGNTVAMLKVWNRYVLGDRFRTALERGVVLSGISAGAIGWFDGGLAAYNGYKPLPGLGLAPGFVLPHFTAAQSGALAPWFAERPDSTVFGIADRCALTWDGRNFAVIGEGSGVWAIQAGGSQRL